MKIFCMLIATWTILSVNPAYGQAWSPNGKVACEKKEHGDIRCGLSAFDWGANAKIELLAKDNARKISLTYEEYHSVCLYGSKAIIQTQFEIPDGKPLVLPMLSNAKNVSCIEGWISKCAESGRPVDCYSVINATILKFKGNKE